MICSYFLVLDTILAAQCFVVAAALQSNPVVFQLGEHCSNPSETSPVTASLFLWHLLLTHVSLFQYFSGQYRADTILTVMAQYWPCTVYTVLARYHFSIGLILGRYNFDCNGPVLALLAVL